MNNFEIKNIDLTSVEKSAEKSPLNREKLEQVLRLLKSEKGEQLLPLIEKKYPELGALGFPTDDIRTRYEYQEYVSLFYTSDTLKYHANQVAEWVRLSYSVGVNPLAILRQDGWGTFWGVPAVAPIKATVIVIPQGDNHYIGVYSPTFGWLADNGARQYCQF